MSQAPFCVSRSRLFGIRGGRKYPSVNVILWYKIFHSACGQLSALWRAISRRFYPDGGSCNSTEFRNGTPAGIFWSKQWDRGSWCGNVVLAFDSKPQLLALDPTSWDLVNIRVSKHDLRHRSFLGQTPTSVIFSRSSVLETSPRC
jgi:hypothetical protein